MGIHRGQFAVAAAIVGAVLGFGGAAVLAATVGPSAAASPDRGSAAAVSVAGVVALSESRTSEQGVSQWSALSVHDQMIVGADKDGWNGAPVPGRTAIDNVNAALCKGGTACVRVLDRGNVADGQSGGQLARIAVAVGERTVQVNVAPSRATASRCSSSGAASLVHTKYALGAGALTDETHHGAVQAQQAHC